METKALTRFIMVLILASCSYHIDKGGSSSEVVADPADETYQWVSKNVFQAKCIGCHSANEEGPAAGGVDLTSYDSAMASGAIVAGNASNSKLFQDILSGDMPKRRPRIDAHAIECVKEWIIQGAKND